jgi:hypothetical protein
VLRAESDLAVFDPEQASKALGTQVHETSERHEQRRSVSDIRSLPRIGTIATMASRLETFSLVLPVIYKQVDHLFVYLDGYASPPACLDRFERVSVFHAEDLGDLHVSSRYLCLQHISTPSVIIAADDDIVYPKDYVDRLIKALDEWNGRAFVGVHGRIFLPPYSSYVRNAECVHFSHRLKQPRYVDVLGCGTSAFVSSQLDVNPSTWARACLDDIVMAIEAQKRLLPRIAIARPAGWLKPYATCQSDSLWRKTLENDAPHTELMQSLLSMYH